MGRADYLALGDWNAVCFQCGHKRKAGTLVRNWQGYYVCPEHNEPRQPQDFVRAIPDDQTAPWVQEMPAAVYQYDDMFIGWGDGVTPSFLLGDGLYPTTVTGCQVNGVAVSYTADSYGRITPQTVPGKGAKITASGSETVR